MCGAIPKLVLDCHAQLGLCDVMDDDSADLIRQLCTRAGMIMEDLSVEALTISGIDQVAISARLAVLADGAKAISALVAAASVLSGSSGEVS
jgi:hypothetical protein